MTTTRTFTPEEVCSTALYGVGLLKDLTDYVPDELRLNFNTFVQELDRIGYGRIDLDPRTEGKPHLKPKKSCKPQEPTMQELEEMGQFPLFPCTTPQ